MKLIKRNPGNASSEPDRGENFLSVSKKKSPRILQEVNDFDNHPCY